jgi:hypothetical protein
MADAKLTRRIRPLPPLDLIGVIDHHAAQKTRDARKT